MRRMKPFFASGVGGGGGAGPAGLGLPGAAILSLEVGKWWICCVGGRGMTEDDERRRVVGVASFLSFSPELRNYVTSGFQAIVGR